mmetsp:Transcript_22098/g.39180  ORF Transcript_22098/g.39180 Transcript_22098/m.39180 type:complete len:212 (+) Transcript_22098:829-1464(+)
MYSALDRVGELIAAVASPYASSSVASMVENSIGVAFGEEVSGDNSSEDKFSFILSMIWTKRLSSCLYSRFCQSGTNGAQGSSCTSASGPYRADSAAVWTCGPSERLERLGGFGSAASAASAAPVALVTSADSVDSAEFFSDASGAENSFPCNTLPSSAKLSSTPGDTPTEMRKRAFSEASSTLADLRLNIRPYLRFLWGMISNKRNVMWVR